MDLHAGVLAAGIAHPHRAITPALLMPRVEAIDSDESSSPDPGRRHVPKLVITLPELGQEYPIPDADTIATMQLTSKIPREE